MDIHASTFVNQVGNPREKRTITLLTDGELQLTRQGVLPGTMLAVGLRAAERLRNAGMAPARTQPTPRLSPHENDIKVQNAPWRSRCRDLGRDK